ncbi:Uncharacterized protein TCM_010897 [Theobroma cacao]|uniref:Uncharacterized protein n=1 Tax=Theobroma cacao TaxID=3641 RepID=A0A061E9E4_THECC|nr:Uncharacterized protein TCM_010897 [Theobroma cacao]
MFIVQPFDLIGTSKVDPLNAVLISWSFDIPENLPSRQRIKGCAKVLISSSKNALAGRSLYTMGSRSKGIIGGFSPLAIGFSLKPRRGWRLALKVKSLWAIIVDWLHMTFGFSSEMHGSRLQRGERTNWQRIWRLTSSHPVRFREGGREGGEL